MIFTEQTFKEVIRGAYAAYTDEQGRLCTKRFTDAQAELIAKRTPTVVFQQAGMRLDFYTDAETIEASFDFIHGTSHIYMSVDVYEDDVLTYSFIEKNCYDNKSGSFTHKFEKKGRKRVTVHLPYSVELAFKKIELTGESYIEPYTDYSAFAYMIGDSITHGFSAEITSQTYASVAQRRLNMDVINQGAGGYVFFGASLDEKLFEGKKLPDIITIAYGTNDWAGKAKEDFYRDIDEFFARLRELYPSIPVLVITPIWRAAYYVTTRVGTFDHAAEYITQAAKKYDNVYVLDGSKLVPHTYDYFKDVRLHPNDIGFSTYGVGVADAIAKILGITPPVHFL